MFHNIVAAIGILFCLFWISEILFVKLHLDWTDRIQESNKEDENTGVSVIHPIKDLDFELEKNLESWFNQNYKGPIQHIFSFQEPEDPAIEVVKSFMEKYPDIDTQIIVNPVISGLNGKSSNMVNGLKISKYDMVLFGDSDIRIKPDFIVKTIRPLKNEKVGITTCGQINIGGKDFWTRFFTFLQNNETDFIWAFLTKLGINVGATGAAFAMRKKVLKEVGGLEAFGDSILEDFHLGNTLAKMGYKLVLGPFLECHVDKLEKEKSINYAKRIGIGIKAHIAVDLPAFLIMLFWYWAIFILGIVLRDTTLIYLSILFMCFRTCHGLAMRVVTKNKILPVDILMGMLFDLFGTFFLIYSLISNPDISWRGIKYGVKKGGFIEDAILEESAVEEHVKG